MRHLVVVYRIQTWYMKALSHYLTEP